MFPVLIKRYKGKKIFLFLLSSTDKRMSEKATKNKKPLKNRRNQLSG